jgi:hypothetical protein
MVVLRGIIYTQEIELNMGPDPVPRCLRASLTWMVKRLSRSSYYRLFARGIEKAGRRRLYTPGYPYTDAWITGRPALNSGYVRR